MQDGYDAGKRLEHLEARVKELEREKEDGRAEAQAWKELSQKSSIESAEAYLNRWPNGEHAGEAKLLLSQLRFGRATRRNLLRAAGLGGLAVLTFVPGLPLWRLINDASFRTFTGHDSAVSAVTFSPDGRTLLSGSRTELILWDLETRGILHSHRGNICSVAISRDGRFALFGDTDATLTLWDIATSVVVHSLAGHGHKHQPINGISFNDVSSVAFSPDGRKALSGAWDGRVKLWDLGTGKEIRTFDGYAFRVETVAFSPDGLTAVANTNVPNSGNQGLQFWDVETGKPLRTFPGDSGYVNSAVYSKDGRAILSGSGNGPLQLWDAREHRPPETGGGTSH